MLLGNPIIVCWGLHDSLAEWYHLAERWQNPINLFFSVNLSSYVLFMEDSSIHKSDMSEVYTALLLSLLHHSF